MTKKIICPNCYRENDEWSVYCNFCGQRLKDNSSEQKQDKEPSSSLTPTKTQIKTEPFPTKTVIVRKKGYEEKAWWKPTKRKRPWYHPLEWFFWLGWGVYIFLRFLFVEIFRYFKWCVCWGPPDDLKKE
ncbi:MAG: hypothetical protein K9W42_04505 [Candidatus Heimdallarchaeota archaeon]|nr:hypothetical protein [Candidatus Heimdallarchaeota archaeon]